MHSAAVQRNFAIHIYICHTLRKRAVYISCQSQLSLRPAILLLLLYCSRTRPAVVPKNEQQYKKFIIIPSKLSISLWNKLQTVHYDYTTAWEISSSSSLRPMTYEKRLLLSCFHDVRDETSPPSRSGEASAYDHGTSRVSSKIIITLLLILQEQRAVYREQPSLHAYQADSLCPTSSLLTRYTSLRLSALYRRKHAIVTADDLFFRLSSSQSTFPPHSAPATPACKQARST